MSYRVVIAKKALKELSDLPKNSVKKIAKSIEALSENPRPAGCKKLKGEEEILWRIRSGDYRVIYSIEDSIRIVEVRRIGHRKNIYNL